MPGRDPLCALVVPAAVVGVLLWTGLRRPTPSSGTVVGALPGKMNPCNWYIEAERQLRGAGAAPDRDLRLTYWDNSDPATQDACAQLLVEAAKKAKVPFGKYKTQLQSGMTAWYKRRQNIGAPRQGSFTFS